MTHKTWIQLRDLPTYAISRQGQVKNLRQDRILSQRVNQQGQPFVSVYDKGWNRSLSPHILVAHYFELPKECPPNMDPLTFDQLIHKNGDKTDCRYENLAWRPRWFAIAFHKQFHRDWFWDKDYPLRDSEGNTYTGERDVVEQLGVLNYTVRMSWHHHQLSSGRPYFTAQRVFPQMRTFELIEE
jgi:hypothetical protein